MSIRTRIRIWDFETQKHIHGAIEVHRKDRLESCAEHSSEANKVSSEGGSGPQSIN
jgi:hypothetical protein